MKYKFKAEQQGPLKRQRYDPMALCEQTTMGRYITLRIIKGSGNDINIPELEINTK